jgi:ribosomal protein L37E
MDAEQRDALRERNRRRAYNCSRCGSPNTREVDGANLPDGDHFPGITYKICGACGHEDVKRRRRR